MSPAPCKLLPRRMLALMKRMFADDDEKYNAMLATHVRLLGQNTIRCQLLVTIARLLQGPI